MAREIPNSPQEGSSRFQQVVDAFLSAPGLPFANVISAERIERIFAKHGCWFGRHGVYTTAAGAALLHSKQPRQISFTGTRQYVLASWMQLSCGLIEPSSLEDYLQLMLRQIASCQVANRPGRLEPRVLKRRRHNYKLMQRPRHQLRRELRKHST